MYKKISFILLILFFLILILPSHFIHASPHGWSDDIRLTESSSTSYWPAIAINNENIHVVWHDDRDGNYEIYYKTSTNNGENWTNDIRLTNDNSNSYWPIVAVNKNNVYVVWHDDRDGNYEIYYKTSTNNGENWTNDIRLTNDNSDSQYPAIIVYENNNHVVWHDDRNGNTEIYYKRSIDNGTTWSNDIRLTNNNSNSYWPTLAVDGNNIHVVWTRNYYEIFYRVSNDNGENWENEKKLANSGLYSEYPEIVVNNNNIHVVWYDHRDGNWEIYYKKSVDNGLNWSSDTRLTIDESYSYWPAIAINNENIHVVWHDDRDGNYEIYYKTSTNNGENWTNDIRLTNDRARSEYPVISVNNNTIHIIWQDVRDNNYEIYYKKKIVNAPIANIFINQVNITKGQIVTFNASKSTGKGLVYYFDFGDGTFINWEVNPVTTHKYSNEGTYIVRLKVRDESGEESLWDTAKIIVGDKDFIDSDGSPGFELIFIILVLSLFIIFKRKKIFFN